MARTEPQPDTCGTCAYYHSLRGTDGLNYIGRCRSWRVHGSDPDGLDYRTVHPGDACCSFYVPRGIAGAELG